LPPPLSPSKKQRIAALELTPIKLQSTNVLIGLTTIKRLGLIIDTNGERPRIYMATAAKLHGTF
jgi:hypothetical protein